MCACVPGARWCGWRGPDNDRGGAAGPREDPSKSRDVSYLREAARSRSPVSAGAIRAARGPTLLAPRARTVDGCPDQLSFCGPPLAQGAARRMHAGGRGAGKGSNWSILGVLGNACCGDSRLLVTGSQREGLIRFLGVRSRVRLHGSGLSNGTRGTEGAVTPASLSSCFLVIFFGEKKKRTAC